MKRQPANFPLLACVFGLLLCSGVLGYTGPAYLASTGPAPLRFQPALQPVVVREQPVAAVSTPKNDSTTTPQMTPMVWSAETTFVSSPAPLFAPFSTSPTLSAQPIVGVQTNAVGGAVPPSDDTVSPQMLLKYFNHSSNGVDTSLYLPMNVPTSAPVQTPPSKASFTNAP